MARRRGQRTGYVYRRFNSWYGQFRVDTAELDDEGHFKRKTLTKFIAPARGPGKVGKKRAMQLFYEEYLKDLHKSGRLSTRTVAEFVGEYFRPQVVLSCKPTGQAHYSYMLDRHILPALGDFMVRDVRPQHVYNLVKAKLDTGLSIQTVTHIRNTLTSVFRHAKRMQAYSGDIPTEGVKLPTLVHAERKVLTWDQVQALSAALPYPIGSLVIVLALTGLRIGEAMGLRWRDVDLERGVLHVRENYVRGNYGTTKTPGSSGEIPLHSLALVELQRLYAGVGGYGDPLGTLEDAEVAPGEQGPSGSGYRMGFSGSLARPRTALNAASAGSTPARQHSDLPVFAGTKSIRWPNGDQVPLNDRNISVKYLKPAGKAIGCPWVCWHSLRHTFSTLAHAVGMSIEQRRKVLRHASDAMTQLYTHPELEGIRIQLEKIGKETVH